MADLTLTPKVYTAAVRAALEALPSVNTALDYGLLREDTPGPVVLVDLGEIDPLEDVDPGLPHATLRVELIILTPTSTRGSKGDAWDVGFDVYMAVRWNRFGLPVMPAKVTLLVRDEVTPLGRAWDAVRVEYTQEVHWTAPVTPTPAITRILLGLVPDVGPGHEVDYEQIVPGGDEEDP